ncbi:MAG: hypothetical protein RLY32_1553 [Pseudomonadota bacterium]|jgi:hypothetical protein
MFSTLVSSFSAKYAEIFYSFPFNHPAKAHRAFSGAKEVQNFTIHNVLFIGFHDETKAVPAKASKAYSKPC